MRLTNGCVRRFVCDNEVAKALYNKLRKLEDIEEKLGVGLDVIYKVLNSDFCYEKGIKLRVLGCARSGVLVEGERVLLWEDFEKTWGLK